MIQTSEAAAYQQLPLTPTSSWMQMLSEDNFQNELSSPDPRTETSNRQLFDFEGSLLSDIFRSPNIADRRITTALDSKLDAVNKKLALLNRQMKEQTEKMNYFIQFLGTNRAVSEVNVETFEAQPLLSQQMQQYIPEESEGIHSAPPASCIIPDSVKPQAVPSTSTMPNMMTSSTTTSGTSYLTIHLNTGASTKTTSVSAFPQQPHEMNNDKFKDIPAPHRLTVDQLYKDHANSRSLNIFSRLIRKLRC
ncbi:MAG: hypothetical protein AB2693_33535 [Candidatus Thiodiazotropha sp.]